MAALIFMCYSQTMSGKLHVITCEPSNSTIVTLFENLLAMAKAGELSSVAVATVDRKGAVDAHWSYAPSIGTLLGSVTRLAYRLNQELDE